MDEKHIEIMDKVVAGIVKAGYDPYEQLTGYLETGEDVYITRTDNARELIKQVSSAEVRRYRDTRLHR